jgi:hypothetical protein
MKVSLQICIFLGGGGGWLNKCYADLRVREELVEDQPKHGSELPCLFKAGSVAGESPTFTFIP